MIKTICILGGGTSGYLTAAYLRSSIPDGVKILLIESSKVGIIGVGEGTQPYTTEFLRKCGLQPIDWMKDANATYKLGVEFTGWSDKPYFVDNDDYGTFLLGPEMPTFIYWMSKSKKQFFDFLQSYRIAKANKSPKINHGMDFTHGFITPSWDAVHFDAHKIGEAIKKQLKRLNIRSEKWNLLVTKIQREVNDGSDGTTPKTYTTDEATKAIKEKYKKCFKLSSDNSSYINEDDTIYISKMYYKVKNSTLDMRTILALYNAWETAKNSNKSNVKIKLIGRVDHYDKKQIVKVKKGKEKSIYDLMNKFVKPEMISFLKKHLTVEWLDH